MLLADWCNKNSDRGNIIKTEWTGESQDGSPVDFNSVTHGSGLKVKWRCRNCSHIWVATINNRTATKSGCPECYEKQRSSIVSSGKSKNGNDLKTWCVNNGELGNKIESEWTGLTEDGNTVFIDKIAAQSNKKVLWVCSNNNKHQWYAVIQKRTLLKSGCPYCTNQKVMSGENDLLTWCKENSKQYLIEQFSGQLEDGTKVSIDSLTKSTHTKVKWRHLTEDGKLHEWIASVSDRTSKNSECPLCIGRNNLKPGINDLETWCKNNPVFGSIITEQWTGLDALGNNISMSDIPAHSHKKVLWKCHKCGSVWESSTLAKLNNKNYCCADCSRVISESNRYKRVLQNSMTLADWAEDNTVYGNVLLSEFCSIDIKGNNITPDKITFGSDKMVLWRHSTSNEVHEWYATVKNRVLNKSRCPLCNTHGTSLPEQVIYRCIKQVYPKTISRGKFKGYEFDIAIPEIKTCIEYGSYYYHKDKQQRDLEKRQLCKNYNVRFINILDSSGSDINDFIDCDNIIMKVSNDKSLIKIVAILLKILHIDISNVDYDKALKESLDFIKM